MAEAAGGGLDGVGQGDDGALLRLRARAVVAEALLGHGGGGAGEGHAAAGQRRVGAAGFEVEEADQGGAVVLPDDVAHGPRQPVAAGEIEAIGQRIVGAAVRDAILDRLAAEMPDVACAPNFPADSP